MEEKYQTIIKLHDSVFEEIRCKVLYPFNNMKEILLYAIIANISIVLVLIIIGCLSVKVLGL